jgi:prepilin-type processing-associated H-X9-DG protein
MYNGPGSDRGFIWAYYAPIRESAVRVPSDMIAFGDVRHRSNYPEFDGGTGNYEIGYYYFPNYAPNPPRHKQSATFKSHRGKFNWVFCDGHIEPVDVNKPSRGKPDELKRWNNDNEPHYELISPVGTINHLSQ